MFGYPETHVLSRACAMLTRSHAHEATTSGGRVKGLEQALLVQLHEAIGSSSGAGGGGGSGVASESNVLNTSALELQRGIQLELTALRYDAGQAFENLHDEDTVKVEALVELAARTEDFRLESKLQETLLNWIFHIRETFDPPKMTALRGRACPKCKETHRRQLNDLGDWTSAPALQVNLSAKPPVCTCLVCGSDWTGGALLDLKALSG